MAPGFENVRQAIADNLNARFNCNAKASELFMTCGCAPALVSVAHALTTSPEDEFIAIAPFFPEYNVFFTCAGAKLAVVPADTVHFQIDMDALEKTINEHSVAVAVSYTHLLLPLVVLAQYREPFRSRIDLLVHIT